MSDKNFGQLKLYNGFSHRFPMPETHKERVLGVLMLGLAILLAALFDPIMDLQTKIMGNQAQAQLIKSMQYRNAGPKQLIGIYVFKDKSQSVYSVVSKTIYESIETIPPKVNVAWPLGAPQKARIMGDYGKRWPAILIGIAIILFGLWSRFKRKDEDKA